MKFPLFFQKLPPFVRQILGAVGGALIALAFYGAYHLLPTMPSLHSAAPSSQDLHAQAFDEIAQRTKSLLREHGVVNSENREVSLEGDGAL